jgi:C_GCAxxG_C_C family probable redox protein
MSNRTQKAKEFFLAGYTCSQAVLMAFAEDVGLEESLAAKISCGFGGGMGGLRNVCGAVTGMFMVANMMYGFETPDNANHKTEHYAAIRELATAFTNEYDTLICKDLLASLPGKLSENPSLRDDEYYKVRPCALYVEKAVAILEEYMANHPVEAKE